MDVEFTKHAEDMLKERKFDKAFIVEVVDNPERKERGVGDVVVRLSESWRQSGQGCCQR